MYQWRFSYDEEYSAYLFVTSRATSVEVTFAPAIRTAISPRSVSVTEARSSRIKIEPILLARAST